MTEWCASDIALIHFTFDITTHVFVRRDESGRARAGLILCISFMHFPVILIKVTVIAIINKYDTLSILKDS